MCEKLKSLNCKSRRIQRYGDVYVYNLVGTRSTVCLLAHPMTAIVSIFMRPAMKGGKTGYLCLDCLELNFQSVVPSGSRMQVCRAQPCSSAAISERDNNMPRGPSTTSAIGYWRSFGRWNCDAYDQVVCVETLVYPGSHEYRPARTSLAMLRF